MMKLDKMTIENLITKTYSDGFMQLVSIIFGMAVLLFICTLMYACREKYNNTDDEERRYLNPRLI